MWALPAVTFVGACICWLLMGDCNSNGSGLWHFELVRSTVRSTIGVLVWSVHGEDGVSYTAVEVETGTEPAESAVVPCGRLAPLKIWVSRFDATAHPLVGCH